MKKVLYQQKLENKYSLYLSPVLIFSLVLTFLDICFFLTTFMDGWILQLVGIQVATDIEFPFILLALTVGGWIKVVSDLDGYTIKQVFLEGDNVCIELTSRRKTKQFTIPLRDLKVRFTPIGNNSQRFALKIYYMNNEVIKQNQGGKGRKYFDLFDIYVALSKAVGNEPFIRSDWRQYTYNNYNNTKNYLTGFLVVTLFIAVIWVVIYFFDLG